MSESLDCQNRLTARIDKRFGQICVAWLVVALIAGIVLGMCYPDLLRGIGFYAAGVGIAPLGLYLARNRTNALQEQTSNERQRRISENFSRSVELLGHKTAAVRQGGIYALGSLANDDSERYATAIKIVASYIRETRKYKHNESQDNSEQPENKYGMLTHPVHEINIAPNGVDVEAALSVIRYRKKNWDRKPARDGDYIFDLSNSSILDGDLSNTSLCNFNLSEIKSTGCVFADTNFSDANMVASEFYGCDFKKAVFKRAQLTDSKFLQAGKTDEPDEPCDFNGADLTDAELYGADLSGADNLTEKQIKSANGDKHTKLPKGLTRPPHWDSDSDNSE